MTDAAKKLMEEVLALPAEDRKRIGVALLDSVDDAAFDDDEDVELSDEWKHEIMRRIEQLRSGKVKPIPGAEVEARLRASLERVRQSRGDD